MGVLVRGRSNSEDTTSPTKEENKIQLASMALDAGIRIYCSRIDSVHTNAFKMLGGLSCTTPVECAEDGNEGDVEDGDEGSKRAKRRPRGGATLEPNGGSAPVCKLYKGLAVEPVFQKMSNSFSR